MYQKDGEVWGSVHVLWFFFPFNCSVSHENCYLHSFVILAKKVTVKENGELTAPFRSPQFIEPKGLSIGNFVTNGMLSFLPRGVMAQIHVRRGGSSTPGSGENAFTVMYALKKNGRCQCQVQIMCHFVTPS